MSPAKQHPLAEALVQWFEQEGKSYPWRETTDPWAILVSEIMLQQTSIATILARYSRWMEQFPTPEHLSKASEAEALRSWEGLGYYRRVRHLQAAAQAIVIRHGGVFPREKSAIRVLPGIGEYTLGALLSFAFNEPAPLVDANVSRVFARLFNSKTAVDSPAGRKEQWQQAQDLLHQYNPRAYNSALMELGQSICTPTKPQCLLCPIKDFCLAEDAESLPVKLPKKEWIQTEHCDILVQDAQRGLLMVQQSTGERHEGMYRLPSRSKQEIETEQLELLCTQNYSVTRYKVKRKLYQGKTETQPREGECFIPLAQLESTPMASPDRKMVQKWALKN